MALEIKMKGNAAVNTHLGEKVSVCWRLSALMTFILFIHLSVYLKMGQCTVINVQANFECIQVSTEASFHGVTINQGWGLARTSRYDYLTIHCNLKHVRSICCNIPHGSRKCKNRAERQVTVYDLGKFKTSDVIILII